MNSDDFEQRLQRQPMRQVPPEWRAIFSRRRITHRASVSFFLLAHHSLSLNSQPPRCSGLLKGLGQPGCDLAAAVDSGMPARMINPLLSPERPPGRLRKGSWLGGKGALADRIARRQEIPIAERPKPAAPRRE